MGNTVEHMDSYKYKRNNKTMNNREITSEYKYVYDPTHEHKPSTGIWKMTGSGWSSSEDTSEETSVTQPNKQPGEKHNVSNDNNRSFDNNTDKIETPTADDFSQPTKSQNREETSVTQDDDEKMPSEDTDQETEDDVGDDFTAPKPKQTKNDDVDVTEDTVAEPDEEEQEQEPNDDAGGSTEENIDEENADDFDVDESGIAGDEDMFDDSNTDIFTDEKSHDVYVSKMNAFVKKFDETEGAENDITFKAVASNLDWDNMDEVLALAERCDEIGIENAYEVMAFLYHSFQKDGDSFDTMIADEME